MNAAASQSANGAQRHTLDRLHSWEALGFGMFIHFGMSTFDGDELSKGDKPASLYAPDSVDVDQWVSVARDAGMKYAVLTAKHVAGHCLWPTRYCDYHVGNSGNRTDVVEAFVKACERRGVLPGLYYCSWDNHNTFGSRTPTFSKQGSAYTTIAYREFQRRQIEELLTQYGRIEEVWIDIPGVLGHEGRQMQYQQIAGLQPDALVMMNHGFGDGSKMEINHVWPTDLMAIERWLPSSNRGYQPWHRVDFGTRTGAPAADAADYYIPGEVCDPIGYEWFYKDDDQPRSDIELLGMRLICRARKVNLLLNVPPNRSGRIPQRYIDALSRLAKNSRQFGIV